MLGEALSPDDAVEGLDAGIVSRLARPGKVQLEQIPASPGVDGLRGECGSVVDFDPCCQLAALEGALRHTPRTEQDLCSGTWYADMLHAASSPRCVRVTNILGELPAACSSPAPGRRPGLSVADSRRGAAATPAAMAHPLHCSVSSAGKASRCSHSSSAGLLNCRHRFGLPKRYRDLLLRELPLPHLPVLPAPSGAQRTSRNPARLRKPHWIKIRREEPSGTRNL